MHMLAVALGLLLMSGPALAQSVPKSVSEGGTEEELRVRKNAWTVGVVSGQLEGLYPRFAAEMQKVLDDGDEMRVMAILAYGAASNIDDLLYTRGVDVAFTQSDALLYFKNERKIANIGNRIHYVAALYNTEFHILARREIKTIRDLAGKNVSFGPPGNSASLTGPIVFQRLKMTVKPHFLDHTSGLEKMKTGEIDAVIRVIGKPNDYFTKIPQDLGFHFLPIPLSESSGQLFDDIYSLGELTSDDYPNLIAKGETVDTVAVATVLAVYNWPQGTDRYRRAERFTEYLFTRFPKFLTPGFHPKWKDVNLAASVPGWTRFSAADRILKIMSKPGQAVSADMETKFKAFVAGRTGAMREEDKDKLFREFMAWHKSSQPVTAPPPAAAPDRSELTSSTRPRQNQ